MTRRGPWPQWSQYNGKTWQRVVSENRLHRLVAEWVFHPLPVLIMSSPHPQPSFQFPSKHLSGVSIPHTKSVHSFASFSSLHLITKTQEKGYKEIPLFSCKRIILPCSQSPCPCPKVFNSTCGSTEEPSQTIPVYTTEDIHSSTSSYHPHMIIMMLDEDRVWEPEKTIFVHYYLKAKSSYPMTNEWKAIACNQFRSCSFIVMEPLPP